MGSVEIQTRDYQASIINKTYSRLRAKILWLLLFAPTGAGKTIIACKIIQDAVKRGKPVLFVARQSPLIAQTIEKLARYGISAAPIKAGMKEDRSNLVQVASIQSLANREYPPAAIVLVDEAHSAVAQQFDPIWEHYGHLPIIGLTATPFRTNKRERLDSRFQEIISEVFTVDLIQKGFLCPYTHYSHDLDLSSVQQAAGDYQKGGLSLIMDTPAMINAALAEYQDKARGKRAVSFAVTCQHARHMYERAMELGIPSAYIDANTPDAERIKIFDDVINGRVLHLASVDVCSEGLDLPPLEVGLMNRPTLSKSKYIQQGGRTLRLSPETGKSGAILFDRAGNAYRHGLLTDRFALSLGEDFPEPEIKIKACPQCEATVSNFASVCPNCGHQFSSGEGSKKHEITEALVDISSSWRSIQIKRLATDARVRQLNPFWVFHRFTDMHEDVTEEELIAICTQTKIGKRKLPYLKELLEKKQDEVWSAA